MALLYETRWAVDGFFQKLPELLLPRILAEGYCLHDSDEGKQVYGRSTAPRGRRLCLFSPSYPMVRDGVVLRVGYTLQPRKTEVVFAWETPYGQHHCEYIRTWVRGHAQAFLDYLNAWCEETGKQLDAR